MYNYVIQLKWSQNHFAHWTHGLPDSDYKVAQLYLTITLLYIRAIHYGNMDALTLIVIRQQAYMLNLEKVLKLFLFTIYCPFFKLRY